MKIFETKELGTTFVPSSFSIAGTWNEFLLQPGTWNLERVPFEEERAQPWSPGGCYLSLGLVTRRCYLRTGLDTWKVLTQPRTGYPRVLSDLTGHQMVLS